MQTIKVEMIHDLVCSWCPIGFRNISEAANVVADTVGVDIRFLPYELSPDMGPDGMEIVEELKARTGWSDSELADYRAYLLKVVDKADLRIDFNKRTHYFNTHKAHVLMHWAEEQGRHIALNEAIRFAYHEEGLNLSDTDTLAVIAARAGLDSKASILALSDPGVYRGFMAKKVRVADFSVRSVPSFIIDEDQFVTGSNSVEFFTEILLERAAVKLSA